MSREYPAAGRVAEVHGRFQPEVRCGSAPKRGDRCGDSHLFALFLDGRHQGLIKFYESPLGQRVVKTLPEVVQNTQQTGVQMDQKAALEVLRSMSTEYPATEADACRPNRVRRPRREPLRSGRARRWYAAAIGCQEHLCRLRQGHRPGKLRGTPKNKLRAR